MAQAVLLPKLGQTVEEAEIVKWHKSEGDKVEKGEVLFEIETDKAVLEAESFYSGTLLKVFVNEGESVPVSSVVAYVGEPGEDVPDRPPALQAGAPAVRPASAEETPKELDPAPAEPAKSTPQESAAAPPPRPAASPSPAQPVQQRIVISPRARALAKACAVDPAPIQGSGPNGRIVEKDVKAYLESMNYDALRITPAAKRLAIGEGVDILSVRGSGHAGRIMVADVERKIAERPRPMSKMRQIIARRLTESFTTIPHFYVTVSVDMTELLAYRQELKDRGDAYTVTDFILEAVVLSLQEFPVVNSSTDGATVRWHGTVELGMAVGLDDGLVVPVIRGAETLSMSELHEQSSTLAKRAREQKLMPGEMTGSTFTVSNMGMLGVENFGAIINPGESAILAVASTVEQAVVIEGRIEPRAVMKITLSVDHRIVDGTTGAAFVNAVKSKLEDIELWKSLTW